MNDRTLSIERSSACPDHARPNSVTVIEASPRQEPANPWPTFAIVAVGTFMIMLDAAIVNISLPSIARTFHTAVGGAMEWVIIAYLVTIAGTLLTFGRLSDMIGRKPIWLSGLASGGLAVACLGLLALAQLNAQSSDWRIIWPLLVTGVGQGLFMTPNARALMNAAPANEQGESSGLLATGRVLGQSLSVAFAGAIFAGLGGAEAGRILIESNHSFVQSEISALQLRFLTGFHSALLVC